MMLPTQVTLPRSFIYSIPRETVVTGSLPASTIYDSVYKTILPFIIMHLAAGINETEPVQWGLLSSSLFPLWNS